MKKLFSNLSFHKEGLKTLKLIHKCDSSAIPVTILYALIDALFPYINIILPAYIIDGIINQDLKFTLYMVGALILGNLIIGIVNDYLKYLFRQITFKIHELVKIAIREHALELDYEVIEDPKVLELVTSAEFSMNHHGGFGFLLKNYKNIIQSIISIIASLILVLGLCFKVSYSTDALSILTSPQLSIVFITIFVLINAFVNLKLTKYLNNENLKVFNEQMVFERRFMYFVSQLIFDTPKGKIIRLFNLTPLIVEEEKVHMDASFNGLSVKMFKIMISQSYVQAFLSGFSVLFAYLFVILKAITKAITIGSMTKYIGAISQLNTSVVAMFKANDDIRIQCSYVKNFNKFMEIKNVRHTGTIPIEKRDDNEYEIEFHNVSFNYPSNDELILDNVSCKLTLKNKMAVVGRNGAGKSTFIKLLCRLYDPTEGYITLNGVDIKKYDYLEYLSLFGVVFQDFNLFAFLLEQNVSASVAPDNKKVWNCLELAGIKNRVEKMPLKEKTPLFKYDDGGIELSGGEAQKIAIARALYKDAPFVILDEPTAALDPISEYEIYSKFDELVEDKTSIYISHRMSSCRFCDDIIVFDRGKIIQRGSHDKLLTNENGLYAHLWNAQAKYYKKKETA
ncbi:ABC transporter ATP-binding protein [Sedimentibacter sp. zth1]|uniref:ABC transporter ATP-binding protein n=1 Tax=Sedimentibacter sp. zth1 TaxID=2816908 RepID=UPI001A913A68|nr:ABC transporter ATP-binding protein [Sedimentibacter sp. zth1]QSX07219.1 ABC transporter ATP-binding protein [Sedimentibacter sp. zth1]